MNRPIGAALCAALALSLAGCNAELNRAFRAAGVAAAGTLVTPSQKPRPRAARPRKTKKD